MLEAMQWGHGKALVGSQGVVWGMVLEIFIKVSALPSPSALFVHYAVSPDSPYTIRPSRTLSPWGGKEGRRGCLPNKNDSLLISWGHFLVSPH